MSNVLQTSSKRRKIRKGTFCCWACKNRKTRCQFTSESSTQCQFCRSRGLKCISQEYANPADDDFTVPGQQSQNEGELEPSRQWSTSSLLSPRNGTVSGAETISGEARPMQLPKEVSFMLTPELLSDQLSSILPDVDTSAVIMSRGRFFSLPIHIRRNTSQKPTSAAAAEDIGEDGQLMALPQKSHPLAFARRLLQLALCLHQLDRTAALRLEVQLRESVYKVANRYVELASRFVTSQDSLVRSNDGLGVLMLEACCYMNVGDFHSAWIIFRRAISIGHLLGMPHPGAKVGSCSETAWFRLVYGDRWVSLLLGLPSSTSENDFAVENIISDDVAFETLERAHAVILGRIVTRNLRMQRHQTGLERHSAPMVYQTTSEIDESMKEAMRSLPTSWWTCPNLNFADDAPEKMKATAVALAQMHHFYYLAMLHLPFVVHDLAPCLPEKEERRLIGSGNLSYNQSAALAASRNTLLRYLPLRKLHQTLSFRSLDDKTYMAVIIVLMCHMNGHRLARQNVLEHQRPQDLQLVVEFLAYVTTAAALNADCLSAIFVDNVKNLMEVEAQFADGVEFDVWIARQIDMDHERDVTAILKLEMPYLGTLCIAPSRLVATKYTASSLVPSEMDQPYEHELDGQRSSSDPALGNNNFASQELSSMDQNLFNLDEGQIDSISQFLNDENYSPFNDWPFP